MMKNQIFFVALISMLYLAPAQAASSRTCDATIEACDAIIESIEKLK